MKRFYLSGTALFVLILNCLSQPFTLDQTFGVGGKVYTNLVDINKASETANVVAVQTDGKIIIAGTTIAPAAVIRYNIDGSLDNAFGHGGMTFCFGFNPQAIAIASDGKIILAGTSNGSFAAIRLNANGSFDNSFDGGGRVTTFVGSVAPVATALAIQNDGKIVLAGYTYNLNNNDFALVRYNADGSLDNAFDVDGKVTLAIGTSDETISCMVIQPDGKILVGGSSYNGAAYDFAVARLNADGTPDNSFDGDGKLTTDISSPNEKIKSIMVQTDGKIVVAGLSESNGSGNMNFQNLIICHYNTDGSLDDGFDSDGKLTITNTYSNPLLQQIYCVGVQTDGRIMLGGTVNTGTSYFDFALVRLSADGSLDNSFDGDGKLITAVGPYYDRANAIAIQNDGKIVAVGLAETSGTAWRDFALVRYHADGSLDSSFDSDGKLTTNISSSDDHATCMAVQADGKIVVAGYSFTTITESSITHSRFTLARYNTDGSLDDTFDGDGRIMTDFGGSENTIVAIAIQSDGKIVVAGTNLATDYDFVLVRYNTDGSLDNTFDGDGKMTASLAVRQDIAKAMVIQPDGKILVGGTARDGFTANYDFAAIRVNPDGSLDNSFDGDGKFYLSIGPGISNDVIASMVVQNDGKILLAGYSHNGNDNDFTLVRLNSNGSLDNSFDGDGIVITELGGSLHNYPSSISIQNDGKIILAGYTQLSSNNNIFALVRYNTNGSLDNTFDGDGIVETDVSTGNDVLTSMTLLNNGKILVGGYSYNGSNNDFTLVRYNSNGGLDNTFGGDGKAFYDLETGSSETCFAVQVTSSRIYMAGSIATAGRSDFVLAAILNDVLSGPLPLHLLDFSGKRINENAQLTWKTDNEMNMIEYVVERSTDGRSYFAIGSIYPFNTRGINNYNFTDHQIALLNVPVIYYRLKQNDSDGSFTYSRIIALAVDKNRNIVLLYPNPVINDANIALTVSRPGKLQARIIDNKGRIVKQQRWNVSAGGTLLSIDVRNLASGMYYLEIQGENIDYKKQFVK